MIGDKIKERRNELNMKQAELSALTGIKPTTISNYENNVSTPNDKNLYRLMSALKCDANYLFEWDKKEAFQVTVAEKAIIKKYRSLDEYGKKAVESILNVEYERCTTEHQSEKLIPLPKSELKASAGTGLRLDDEYTTWVNVPDTPTARQANIVIEVSGDSMEPEFSDGDNVLVRLTPDIDEGEIGVFSVDGDAFIKKKGSGELISLNSAYNHIKIGEYSEVKCFGKVLGKTEIQ